MEDRTIFNNYMTAMGEIFDKTFTRIFVETYWIALKGISDDQGEMGFKKALASCKFFPRPAEILDLAGASEETRKLLTEHNAQTQAFTVLQIMSNRLDEDRVITDPITKYLLKRRFKLSHLRATLLEKDNKWFIRDFCEAYMSCSNLDKVGLLELPERARKINQLTEGIGNE
jgi:hypothetical protein